MLAFSGLTSLARNLASLDNTVSNLQDSCIISCLLYHDLSPFYSHPISSASAGGLGNDTGESLVLLMMVVHQVPDILVPCVQPWLLTLGTDLVSSMFVQHMLLQVPILALALRAHQAHRADLTQLVVLQGILGGET